MALDDWSADVMARQKQNGKFVAFLVLRMLGAEAVEVPLPTEYDDELSAIEAAKDAIAAMALEDLGRGS